MSLSRKLSLREKVLLSILSFVVVFAVYFITVQQPIQAEIERITAAQEGADMELAILSAKQERLTQMENSIRESMAGPYAAQTPSYDNLQQLMALLNALLAGTEDYSIGFQTQGPGEDGAIVRRSVSMNFTCCDYAFARSVIEQLSDSPYRCLIENVRMSPSEKSAEKASPSLSSSRVQVSLSVTFFEYA